MIYKLCIFPWWVEQMKRGWKVKLLLWRIGKAVFAPTNIFIISSLSSFYDSIVTFSLLETVTWWSWMTKVRWWPFQEVRVWIALLVEGLEGRFSSSSAVFVYCASLWVMAVWLEHTLTQFPPLACDCVGIRLTVVLFLGTLVLINRPGQRASDLWWVSLLTKYTFIITQCS